jgi:flagellar biosynthetic protein FliP
MRTLLLKASAICLGFMALIMLLGMAGDMAFAQQGVQAPQVQAPVQPDSATPPAAAGGQPGALDRAVDTISGDGRPLSLSLQILILMIGLALFLSIFVMRPAIDQINETAYTPYGAGQISIEEAVTRSGRVLHGFMMAQTRENDLKLFADLANSPGFQSPEQVPFSILLPAFVTSELKTAFQIGFLIFLPFLIIDIVVSSTLMALGMMMLSPPIVSMPFKLLLFVLVDGWALTMGSLASSFASG